MEKIQHRDLAHHRLRRAVQGGFAALLRAPRMRLQIAAEIAALHAGIDFALGRNGDIAVGIADGGPIARWRELIRIHREAGGECRCRTETYYHRDMRDCQHCVKK